MNKFLALLLCATVIAPAFAADSSAKKTKKEKPTMEWNGSFSPVDKPEQAVIRAEDEWKALWAKIGKPAPAADFKNYFAVAIFLGTKPTGGYSVAWGEPKVVVMTTGPVEAPKLENISLSYKVKKPSGMAIEALTQPYAIKLFKKSKAGDDVEVKVEASHD
jgi:hypothetical protein